MTMLETMLRALPVVGPVVAAAPEFVALWNGVADLLSPADQATAKAALADAQADNDEGHRRLQEKLRAAAGR